MLVDEIREAGLDDVRNARALLELARMRIREGKVMEGLEYIDE
jgi:hypothetical protein